MLRFALFCCFPILLFSCGNAERKNDMSFDPASNSHFTSTDSRTFEVRFADDETSRQHLYNGLIYGSENQLSIKTIKGLPALEIKTDREFSDGFLDLQKLFGHPIDFQNARFLSMKLLVPAGSWISAMKLNFKDAAGNFGGIGEIANNFYGHYDQWIDVAVDLRQLVPNYKSWHGTGNPLPTTTLLSLNPYNAHQADYSVIYVHSIRLNDEKEAVNYTKALVDRPNPVPNVPFTIDFDDDETRQRHLAYRSFESSFQALRKGVAGNSSMAIRLQGNAENKFIAFLPKLHEITGQSVDFTQVERIKFSYYLTAESDDFKSSSLYLVTENWDDILYDENVYSDFKKGAWQEVVLELKELDFTLLRGQKPVLPSVYELRLALEYEAGKKNIEMWLDNFSWE